MLTVLSIIFIIISFIGVGEAISANGGDDWAYLLQSIIGLISSVILLIKSSKSISDGYAPYDDYYQGEFSSDSNTFVIEKAARKQSRRRRYKLQNEIYKKVAKKCTQSVKITVVKETKK